MLNNVKQSGMRKESEMLEKSSSSPQVLQLQLDKKNPDVVLFVVVKQCAGLAAPIC